MGSGLTAVSSNPLEFANLFHGGPVLLYLDGEHLAHASVDASGNWKATLAPHEAAFDKTLTAVGSAGNTSIKVNFGDVLLCSGQSNMDMPIVNKEGGFQADDGPAEVARSSKYTGGIWLWKQVQSIYHNSETWAE